MAYNDIQRLRQQSLFNIAPQMDMGGGMDMGGSYAPEPMNYAQQGPMGGRYTPPPIGDETPSRDPTDIFGQPSTGPTFPNQGTMDPRTVQAPGGGSPTTSVPGQQTLEEYIAMINKGYTPDFTDRDRLRALMDAVPERKAPSFARALTAAALSVKSQDPVKTAETVMQAPYLRDMASWKEKTEPFYKTADLENRQNINERTLMTNAVTAKTAADRLAENARQADLKNEQALGRNRIAMMKAQLGQGYKIIARGTTIKILNTATGDVRDTGMSTGWMNEEDKIDAEGQWRVDAADARGTAAVKTAEAAATATGRGLIQVGDKVFEPDPERPGNYREVTGLPPGVATRPSAPGRATTTGTGARPNTLETRRQIQDRMQTLYQTDPVSKKYIRRGSGGGYEWRDRPVIAEAGIFPWSADAVTQDDVDAYDQIRSEVDPSYKIPAKGLAPTTVPGAGGGRGGGAGNNPAAAGGRGAQGANPQQQKTVTRKQYSPSRNQTRITYSDGTTATVSGRQ